MSEKRYDICVWICAKCNKDNVIRVIAGTPVRSLFNKDEWQKCMHCNQTRDLY